MKGLYTPATTNNNPESKTGNWRVWGKCLRNPASVKAAAALVALLSPAAPAKSD